MRVSTAVDSVKRFAFRGLTTLLAFGLVVGGLACTGKKKGANKKNKGAGSL